uniref:Uncharacterized protein n=1 Tax=Heliothis virescens TaxID=7102 RepID=A0A2A4JSI3_HELVI
MNVQRTPPASPRPKLLSGSDCNEIESGNTINYEMEDSVAPSYVNLRKRKERSDEHEYNETLALFRTDIMNFMESFGNKQTENLKQIQNTITEIKNELKTIKQNSTFFTQQMNIINKEIENIKLTNITTQHKMETLENEITQIKTKHCTDTPIVTDIPIIKTPIAHSEDIIQELKDRTNREKNIIIVGIAETNDKNLKTRQDYDCNEVIKMLTSLKEDCPKPIKTVRLGKYSYDKNRPIKAYFNNSETPKYLLRNKIKLPENIQFYADQTPTQKCFLQSLRDELNKRVENGEKDLIIKYIKGVPTIVVNNNNQKNY